LDDYAGIVLVSVDHDLLDRLAERAALSVRSNSTVGRETESL